MKNQICTILGGGGFIGRYLVRNLTKKNYRCIISTRNSFQKGYLKTQATPGSIELVNWNSNNFDEIKESIKNSDVVINLIGILYETKKQKFMISLSVISQIDSTIDMLAGLIGVRRNRAIMMWVPPSCAGPRPLALSLRLEPAQRG